MSSAHTQRVMAIAGAQRISDALGYALPTIQAGKDEALGYLRDAQGNAIGAIDAGQPLSIGAIDAGQGLSIGSLGSRYDAARGNYRDASARFDPYVTAGHRADGVYEDSLGLNGPEGYDRTVATFREGPGYRYRVDQALDGVNRHAAATGALAGGNTMAALETRAGNEADQEFGHWQDRVKGVGDRGFAATGAQAGFDKGIGDLTAAQGRDEASVYYAAGRARASIYDGNAARRAGIYTGIGSGMASTATGAANNMAQTYVAGQNSIANLGMKAGDATAKAKDDQMNQWLNLAKLGATVAGGQMGGKAFGSIFGGGGSIDGMTDADFATGWF